jgi:glycosyltransferase involved in cell wall biosynthesis
VLISAGWLGGAGGAERALHSVLRALSFDEVDVVVRQQLGGSLAETGPRVRVFSMGNWRWKAAAVASGPKGAIARTLINPIRRLVLPRYDVYLQFFAGPSLGTTIRAGVRLLVPSGNYVPPAMAAHFDYVALQAPDNSAFVEVGTPTVLLPPPVWDVSGRARPPSTLLPQKFLLTVFNAYDPIKGVEDLALAVDSAPYPIVWCHSQQTVSFPIPEKLRDHPRIIHVEDPDPDELRFLYENCLAYLSFSRSEGFAWSVADALRYSPLVVSRGIGVLSYPESRTSGTLLIENDWDIDWSCVPADARPPERSLNWISPDRFRNHLLAISAAHPGRS